MGGGTFFIAGDGGKGTRGTANFRGGPKWGRGGKNSRLLFSCRIGAVPAKPKTGGGVLLTFFRDFQTGLFGLFSPRFTGVGGESVVSG